MELVAPGALVPDVVERADVGVVERRDSLGLTLEAGAPLLVGGEVRGQQFDRDRALEPCVARSIDLAHAPGRERRDDLVWSEAGGWPKPSGPRLAQ